MGFLDDVWKFERNKMDNAWGKYKKDPERIPLGINTPFESKMWGGVTGKNYSPTVDMYGGATEDDSATAKEKGINTGPGEQMHDIARNIVNFFVMKKANSSSNGKAGYLDNLSSFNNMQQQPVQNNYSNNRSSFSSADWYKNQKEEEKRRLLLAQLLADKNNLQNNGGGGGYYG